MTDKIIEFVTEAFKGRTDKGGQPYINHLLWVANEAYKRNHCDIRLKWIGLLHDILEDTDTSSIEIVGLTNDMPEVLDAIEDLTHRKNESYEFYIQRVAGNPLARKVKICDLEHNMDIRRLNELTNKDVDRLKKYHKHWSYLKSLE